MNGNKKTLKRTLSFVLMSAFVLTLSVGAFSPVQADAIASTPYVTTTDIATDNLHMGPGPVVLCSTIGGTLRIGDRDGIMPKRVTILQNFLNKKGYLSVTATGYFGAMTRQAVIAFQTKNGLKADGIVGVQTEAHISAVDCPPSGTPVASAPTISAITPSTVAIGGTITVTGTNFTADSVLHFSSGAMKPVSIGNAGTTMTFTIPEYIGPYCKADMACPAYVMLVSNGVAPVYVENADGTISNTVQLTITGAKNPAIQ
jgi:peptidoglycan hydrolase-like protein with peptidoglycan-binding domain